MIDSKNVKKEISVLISVYKSENPEYLDRALKSVWDDQILKPDEIILIKDGPLNSELNQIIDKWHLKLKNQIVILNNEENLGLTVSLNKGIKESKGKYIARMDSDDISTPQRFKLQYSFLETHPEIALIGGGIQEIDEHGKWGAERKYPLTNEKIIEYIPKANPIAHPTAFIRNSVFSDGFYYDERYRKNQDLKLWFDLIKAGYILGNIKDTVLFFRRTSDTYRKRASKISLKSELKIYFSGIKSIYGIFTWRYIFPLMRLFIKLLPPNFHNYIYKNLFKKKND